MTLAAVFLLGVVAWAVSTIAAGRDIEWRVFSANLPALVLGAGVGAWLLRDIDASGVGAGTLVGNVVGKRALGRISAQGFSHAVYAFVGASGLGIAWRSIWGP